MFGEICHSQKDEYLVFSSICGSQEEMKRCKYEMRTWLYRN